MCNKQTKLIKNIFIQQQFAAFIGFYLGLKFCDYLFYEEDKFLLTKELEEEKFWEDNWTPKNIKPDLIESYKPDQIGKLRKTYIKIKFEKDKYLPNISN